MSKHRLKIISLIISLNLSLTACEVGNLKSDQHWIGTLFLGIIGFCALWGASKFIIGIIKGTGEGSDGLTLGDNGMSYYADHHFCSDNWGNCGGHGGDIGSCDGS